MNFVSVCNRLRYRTTLLAAASALAVLGLNGPAHAGTIAAAEVSYDKALLSNFNLVTLGDVNASSTVYTSGRVIVGGNLNVPASTGYGACTTQSGTDTCGGNLGSSVYVDATKRNYGVLTVFGNVVGGTGAYYGAGFNSGGTANIRGSASGTLYAADRTNVNVAGSTTGLKIDSGAATQTSTTFADANKVGNQTGATYTTASASTVFPFSSSSISSEVKNLAAGIAKLPGTPGVSTQSFSTGSNVMFTSQNDYTVAGKHYAVVTTTVAELTAIAGTGGTGQLTINNNGQDTTFVIVKGDCPSCLLPTLNSYAGQEKVIFDFVDATALKFAGAWNASILAPLATITTMGGYINGTVIVNSINQSNALYATNLFAGDLTGLIPEPASLALFGIGAAAAGVVRRRRRKLAA